MLNKNLLDELFNYKLCKIKEVSELEAKKLKKDETNHICTSYDNNFYLCEMDDLVNTRILLGIFKCVNFMKNVLVAGLVCGGIGVLILAISLIGK